MADRIPDDEFMGALLRFNTWKNLPSFLREQFSDKATAHTRAHNKMSDELMAKYPTTQAGTPFDIAKNYAGGYDYGYRSPEDIQRAVDMARLYQIGDVLSMPIRKWPWEYAKEYHDAKNDFYENAAGVRAGATAQRMGLDYDPELIKALGEQFAEKHQRKARGGLIQVRECNCGR